MGVDCESKQLQILAAEPIGPESMVDAGVYRVGVNFHRVGMGREVDFNLNRRRHPAAGNWLFWLAVVVESEPDCESVSRVQL